MNLITPLLVLVAAAATIGVTSAQAQEMCSCSPTVFTFTLSLDQTCEDNTIEGSPGIDGSFCFMEYPSRKLQDTTAADTIAADGEVTEIFSVQFLEFDTSGDLTVINQDDTYSDVSLSNGDQFKFYSASSFLDTSLPLEDQMSSPALVPGGTSLIIYGKTESGIIVRNRFFWMYDMNCGNDNNPVNVDDKIGWVKVNEIANAWPTFCPALPAGSPTISPRSNEPTLTPSKSPTLQPSNIGPKCQKKGKSKASANGSKCGKKKKKRAKASAKETQEPLSQEEAIFT